MTFEKSLLQQKMAAQQEQHPVDDLFRQTFSDLPASGSSSGWDTPSDRVWEQVQVGMKPRSGWSAGAQWLVAAGLVAVAAAAWWYTSRPATVAPSTTQETPVVSPSVTPPAPAVSTETPTPTASTPATQGAKPAPAVGSKPRPAVNSTDANNKTPDAPATGRQAPPNSTERAKQQNGSPMDH